MSLVNNKMGPSLKVEHLQKLLKVIQVMNNVFNLTECESMYRTDSAQIRSAFSPWRNKLATIIYNSWFRLLQTSHVSLWLPRLSGSFEEIFCCNSREKMLFIVNMYQSPLTSVSWYLCCIEFVTALRLLHLLNYIVKSNDLNMHQLRLVSCPLLICQMGLELNTWHCRLVKQEYLVLYNLGWKNTCPVLVVGTNVYVYRMSS